MTCEKDHNGKAEQSAARQSGEPAQRLSPEAMAKLGEVRSKLGTAFAQVTMALMATPRYRSQSLADLEWLVLQPLLRDRIAIASAKQPEVGEADKMSG